MVDGTRGLWLPGFIEESWEILMRAFVISQLTMMSTWFGIILILVALLLPRDYVIILGIAVLLTDDAHLQKMFGNIRKLLESWWK